MNGSRLAPRWTYPLAVVAVLAPFLLFGCATGGQREAAPPPMLTILTIPPGADISVQGNFIGQSPVTIPLPVVKVDMGAYYRNMVGRVDQPLTVEAQLAGYVTKSVALGEFHGPEQRLVQPLFSASAVATTAAGYYMLPSQVTIKLLPEAR